MKRTILTIAGIIFLLATRSSAQTCGFLWTVTAAHSGGASATINICGYFAGCRPHDPQVTVDGSQIRVTVRSNGPSLDRCQCIAVEDTFHESVTVRPLLPGTYAVTATLLSCGPPLLGGSTIFTLTEASLIPVLSGQGKITLVSLIAIAGIALLRR